MSDDNNQVKFVVKNGKMTISEYQAKKHGEKPNPVLSKSLQKEMCRAAVYNANQSARKSSLPHTLTLEQWEHALDYFHGLCAVCHKDASNIFKVKISIDHWIPLSYKGNDNPGSVVSNIIPLCCNQQGCNGSKSSKMPNDWLQRKFGKRRAKIIAARIQDYFDSL